MLNRIYIFMLLVAMSVATPVAMGATLLVEAESFGDKGGWVVDQQFMDNMGSPYLLAHGRGESVADAVATVEFPSTGTYKMWVRTKDWVPGVWDSPGTFQVLIDGTPAGTTFGTVAGWGWQDGGTINVTDTNVSIRLHDLTGFDGRCDAIYFDTNTSAVPVDFDAENPDVNRQWRNGLRGLPSIPPDAGQFDVVIVGGGIAGCGAALAADKEGLSVALIQDRPLLGGNASSEIRVHTLGVHGEGGDILTQLDTKHYANGSASSMVDQSKREAAMAAATHVTIFSSHRAYDVQMSGSEIVSVDACSTLTGAALRFRSNIFIDCTGDGWIGYWAGADFRYGRESKDEFGEEWATHGDLWSPTVPDNRVMGSSLLWNSKEMGSPSTFPSVPWAMDVAQTQSSTSGGWNWEYSDNDKHQIDDAEEIRDHLLRAIYGSFYNAKQSDNANRKLNFVGYLNGKRESRRLMGDYIYKQSDGTSGTLFDDAVVQEIRSIDVHYQKILNGTSTVDFLSKALFKDAPHYYIPFRCLYSRNIDNLMMAGRDFSCTHIGLGGPRVMNTCGQMGIATGYAASLCKKYDANPRGIYTSHIEELKGLVNNIDPSAPVQREIMNDGLEAAEDLAGNGWTGLWNLSTGNYGNPAHYIWSAGDKGTTTKDTGYAIQSGDELELVFDLKDMNAKNAVDTGEEIIAKLFYNDGVSDVVLGSVGNNDLGVPGGWNDDFGLLVVAATAGSVGHNLQVSFEYTYTPGVAKRFGIDNVFIGASTPDLDGDGDGMPDAWESANGLNPSMNDADLDLDGDGSSNFSEYVANTDPQDANSEQVYSFDLAPTGNEMTIRFGTSSNRLYAVDYRDSLTEGDWVSFQPYFSGTGEGTNFIDSATTERFYRIQVQIP